MEEGGRWEREKKKKRNKEERLISGVEFCGLDLV
jgi:hypothetical protein